MQGGHEKETCREAPSQRVVREIYELQEEQGIYRFLQEWARKGGSRVGKRQGFGHGFALQHPV